MADMSTQPDDFEAAFEQALTDEATTPPSAGMTPTSDDEPAPKVEATDDEPAPKVEATDDEPAPKVEATDDEPAPKIAAVDDEPAPKVNEPAAPVDPQFLVKAILEAAGHKPAAAAPEPAKEPEKEPALDDFLTAEQKEVLKAYDEDWGEVSKAEAIRRAAELQLMEAKITRRIEKEFETRLAPVAQNLEQSQVASHYAAIRSAHSDFDETLNDVVGWVEKQPELVRPAYQAVLDKGTAQQVIQLFDAYKQATGKTGAAPDTTASPTSQPAPRKQPSKEAVAATAAVSTSQRSSTPQGVDLNDFESAFQEAIAS